MKKLNKRGFTLIELMIVLAIIAILAVVLIPKAGTLKDSTKNTGVVSNVNNVRAYLETKVTDKANYNVTTLTTAIGNAFPSAGENAISNPFTKNAGIGNQGPAGTVENISISVSSHTGTVSNAMTTAKGTAADDKGNVYVYVCTDGFVVFGVDNNGVVVGMQGIN